MTVFWWRTEGATGAEKHLIDGQNFQKKDMDFSRQLAEEEIQ